MDVKEKDEVEMQEVVEEEEFIPLDQARRPESDDQATLDMSMVDLTQSGSVSVPRKGLNVDIQGLGSFERNRAMERELEEKFGEADCIVVTTKAHGDHFHWLRLPRLRQEWIDVDHTILRRDKQERKANLMELFYDLIFVAVISLLGHSIRLQATLSANFFIEFLALFYLWFESVMFLDLFDNEDGLSRILILLIMSGIVGMGISGFESQSIGAPSVATGYAVSFIWARTSVIHREQFFS
jgi:hypothetical protein